MGQLSQLVLLASILASCISYSIDSTKTMPVPELPVEPSKSNSLEYPTEFMDKLIASLSPEQFKKLQPINLAESNLGPRGGNTDIKGCDKKNDHDMHNKSVTATDGEDYFVLHYQPVTHYVCVEGKGNDTYGSKCKPAHPQRKSGYCCRQRKAEAALQVIPVAALTRFKNGNDINEISKMIIERKVLMNSDCICDRLQEMVDSENNYACPNPEATFWTPITTQR